MPTHHPPTTASPICTVAAKVARITPAQLRLVQHKVHETAGARYVHVPFLLLLLLPSYRVCSHHHYQCYASSPSPAMPRKRKRRKKKVKPGASQGKGKKTENEMLKQNTIIPLPHHPPLSPPPRDGVKKQNSGSATWYCSLCEIS